MIGPSTHGLKVARRFLWTSASVTLLLLCIGTAQAESCPTFLRTNPYVLRTIEGYAQSSARNTNMSADLTVKFVASSITEDVRRIASREFNRNASLYYQSLSSVDRSTIHKCWPDLNAVLVGKEQREAVEAEHQRQQQLVEQQKKQQNDAATAKRVRDQAAVDAQPSNKLLRAYHLYIDIKLCFESRKGYEVVYLNEEQLSDAKTRVVAIEQAVKEADPTIDTDAIWRQANDVEVTTPTNGLSAIFQFADIMGRKWVSYPDWIEESDEFCKRAYSSLSEHYSSIIPDASVVKKDF